MPIIGTSNARVNDLREGVFMLGWTITAFSAVMGLVIWYRILVPFDRMHRMSEHLNDPGYLRDAGCHDTATFSAFLERIPNRATAVSARSFV
jgi:hypothetical protein